MSMLTSGAESNAHAHVRSGKQRTEQCPCSRPMCRAARAERRAMPMLTSGVASNARSNAHAHVRRAPTGAHTVRGNAHAHVRWARTGAQSFRGNAHAHVEARAATGRTLRHVERPQCPCSCPFSSAASWAAPARTLLSPPKVGWPSPGVSLENSKDRIF